MQLHDVEISRPSIEHAGKVDVGFEIGFVLIQVGNGHILPGTGDEGKADAFLFHDHLAVGAEGGRATRLAGIDRVARGDVDAGRLVGRVLAGGDDGRIRDPHDIIAVDFSFRVRRGEHQEQVLTGGRIGQTEWHLLTGSDENLIQQVECIVGVAGVRMLERLVQHGPDLAAGDRRSGWRFLDVGSEHDGAGWICQVVVWRVGCPLSAHAA
ncbi:hypothetical protein D3C78_826770 [compost metagenome]